MDGLAELFATGRVADLILATLLLEAGVLWLLGQRGIGPGVAAAAPFLLAGACFALALRGALTGQPWPWIAVPLVAALAAHLWDLWRRGRG
jgi:hypothetical protein